MYLCQVVSLVSVLFVVVSIVSFCLKTHHTMKIPVVRNATFQRPSFHSHDDVTFRRGVTSLRERREGYPHIVTSEDGWMLERRSTMSHRAFFYTECFCLSVRPSVCLSVCHSTNDCLERSVSGVTCNTSNRT